MVAPGYAAPEDPHLGLQLNRRLHQRLHGRDARVVEVDVEEHLWFDQRHLGLDLTANLPRQNGRGLQASFSLVDVGIGLVDDQGIGCVHQFRGHVGVVVVSHGNGQVAHQRAHPAHGLSVSLRELLGDHGPVQCQQHPVELGGRLQPAEDAPDKVLVRIRSHRATRSRRRRQERIQFIAKLLSPGDIAGNLVESSLVLANHIRTFTDPEVRQLRRLRIERIRLVGKTRCCNAHSVSPF